MTNLRLRAAQHGYDIRPCIKTPSHPRLVSRWIREADGTLRWLWSLG